jgi:hypothetical protein
MRERDFCARLLDAEEVFTAFCDDKSFKVFDYT